jgi:RNA polymerase sigma factor (sigma-70 family)
MNTTSAIDRLLRDFPNEEIPEAVETAHVATIARYKAGKQREAAVEALVLGHLRDAFFYARKCAYSRIDDDELVSLCYSALTRAAERVKPNLARFFAYAKPYIRGAICRTWKSKDTVRGAWGAESLDVDLENEDSKNEPSQEAEFALIDLREKWELVKPLMSKLSKREQMVLQLFYEGGFNFRQIGDMLGVTRSATQGTHTRALRKIRNALMRQRRLYL